MAKDRKAWRSWLENNGASKKAVWLVFYKKHTGKPTVSYEEAVQEAICFGWIDSILRGIDDRKHAQKFTPRSEKTVWSETNVRRAEPKTFSYFKKLAPSQQRPYLAWVTSAKKVETRRRRLKEMILKLKKGEGLGMK
ncbi:MAG: YdeI/OmpD-associated family protein [Candidatus Aminicenantales bacterium]